MPDWTAVRLKLMGDSPKSVLPPTLKLPILPQAVSEFSQRAQDPEADPRALSKIIESDSGLSSELLRHVNSSATGVQSKVTSVQQALAMLGIRSANLYLATSAVKNAMRSTQLKLMNFQNFWNTNLERALLAREAAKLLGADRDLAFTSGVLQDFLLPMITNELFKVYVEFAEHRDNYVDLASFEEARFGWNHAEAGAQVMYGWGFPDELVCCVLLHHGGTEMVTSQKPRGFPRRKGTRGVCASCVDGSRKAQLWAAF